jgi:hypothetical protein
MRFRKLRRGRCSSCDFEHRQMNNGWGLTALFVDLGSWSQPIKTNCRLAPSGARPEGWSLLLAAASDRASIGGLPKGSGQGSRATTTIIILGHLLDSRLPGIKDGSLKIPHDLRPDFRSLPRKQSPQSSRRLRAKKFS